MFITFEGIDGSGKTTQSELLANYFKQIHGENNVVLTREPGGTDFAEKIRGLLLKDNIDPISELLLFTSMRYEHMKELILPALKEGKTVICDRFIDSTIAYQGYGLGVDLSLIRDLHKLVEIKYPDITFILDIDVQVGLSRAKDKNKYEEMDVDFYNKVREGFQEIAIKESNRCNVITGIADKDNNKVYSEIIDVIRKKKKGMQPL
ncbi:Thymidylate kinase [Wolbachia endosymbiont of Drosophila simulans wNo]|uniref:dTMP kinase n=1 Tax=unclassified Wolbachia TaxID=2640676 RepID=UPI0002D24AC3|nr:MULTISPECIES: dTMP kinase [unclassified Wolbachia]AGJ98938.1 Thymidylate kinase [Wolbachia endosymbiont of Drosophila simulans wNo]QCB62193.1 dTMP kinase [Wolbachia endosymbiont of Drosophila mauritiana]QCB63240.1 dTMP kinase [Wolbachia endosymbiont of Drosophila mauritiana]QWE33501.1 Thymidylate kinase [Wolbachia endosymbiont of Drosophila simulans]TGB06332.1 dTMP kinase [Wolbachia endosymbiont of Drosophila mauritiana]